ncbi:MAG: hypothetical protein HQL76_15905 [Magnetococcales bacterium]|nr:hypothetical protein [Magnetococcales bacterium]
MVEIAKFFSGLGGHLVLAFLVISGFLSSLLLFFVQTHRIGVQVRRGLILLQECGADVATGTSDSPDPTTRDTLRKQRFAANWTRFKSGMESPEMHFFAQAWAEFGKHLVVPPPESGKMIGTTAEPSLYINERSLFFVNINSRLYDAIPGFLTGGGIFGTFVGLVAGIYLAQDGMSSGPDEMRQAMKFLMGGVSTAFLTSIFGIGLSILFSVLEKRRQYQIGRLVQRFSEELESCLEIKPPENSTLNRIHTAQKEQLEELQNLRRIFQKSDLFRTPPDTSGPPLARDTDVRIGASLTQSLGKMFETLVKYQDSQREFHQASLQKALAPFLEHLPKLFSNRVESLELALHAIGENLKVQQKSLDSLVNVLKEGRREEQPDATHAIRETLDGVGTRMASVIRESSENLHDRLDRSLRTLSEAITGLQGSTTAAQEKLVTEVGRFGVDVQGRSDRNIEEFEKNVSNLKDHLDRQSERMAEALREATRDLRGAMEGAGALLNTNLRQSSDHFSSLLGTSIADLAVVASGMKEAQLEIGALLRDSSAGMALRLEHTIAGLAEVANGMKTAQSELVTLLRQSAAGHEGRMEQTLTQLGDLLSNLKSAQSEMVRILGESDGGYKNQIARSLHDMAASETLLRHAAASLEQAVSGMATQLSGSLGQLNTTQATMAQGIDRASETMAERMEESLASLVSSIASQFTASAAQVSRQQSDVATEFRQVGEHISTRMEENLSAILANLSSIHQVQDEIRHHLRTRTTPSPEHLAQTLVLELNSFHGRFEEKIGGMIQLFERMEANNLNAMEKIGDGHQSVANALQASQRRQTLDNDQLQTLFQATGLALKQSADELNTAAARISQALHHSRQSADENQMAMHKVFDFLHGFDAVQSRFGQMIQSMESGAMMIAVAGEKLHEGSAKMESVTRSLNDTQETARQTLTAIAKSHERLRDIWNNYQNRFEGVDASLERSFIQLNHGLEEFSGRVMKFIAGIDDHMGSITEKLGYNITDFGSRLEDLDDSMSRFLERMSETLIVPMQETSLKMITAGERIDDSMQRLGDLSHVLSATQGATQDGAEQTLKTITAAQEHMRETINLMQHELETTWTEQQHRFDLVNASLQQTVASLNSDLEEFSSEKVLEFIGGVDEHMDVVSRQLHSTIGDFNDKLDDLNESITFFLKSMSHLKQ